MRELIRDRDRLEHIVEAIDCMWDAACSAKRVGYFSTRNATHRIPTWVND